MNPPGRNLIDIPQHLAAAVADGDMVGIVLEEPYLLEHLWNHALHATVEGGGDRLVVGAESEVLIDVRLEALEGDSMPRHRKVRELTGEPVGQGHALGVDHVERLPGGVLHLELLPRLVVPPPARLPLVEVQLRDPRAGILRRGGYAGPVGDGGGEDMDPVSPAREGGVEGVSVPLHTAGNCSHWPFPGEDRDLQGNRGPGSVPSLIREIQTVPCKLG